MISPGPFMSIQAYKNLTIALEYYSKEFEFMAEIPWIVGTKTLSHTNSGARILPTTGFRHNFNDSPQGLIGSAEQGFVELWKSGNVLPEKAMAISPCFRYEPIDDTLHQQCFMKVELIHFLDTADYDVVQLEIENMVYAAMGFFKHLCPESRRHNLNIKKIPPKIVRVGIDIPSRFDIQYTDIELGSYGSRVLPGVDRAYIYGTGLAEPRFSIAMAIDDFCDATNTGRN